MLEDIFIIVAAILCLCLYLAWRVRAASAQLDAESNRLADALRAISTARHELEQLVAAATQSGAAEHKARLRELDAAAKEARKAITSERASSIRGLKLDEENAMNRIRAECNGAIRKSVKSMVSEAEYQSRVVGQVRSDYDGLSKRLDRLLMDVQEVKGRVVAMDIGNLSPLEQKVYLLRGLGQQKKIAEKLNITPQAVHQVVVKLRAKGLWLD